MYSEKIDSKQHTAWLMSAMLAPVTQAASNCSWPVALVIATLCIAISYGMERMELSRDSGRWIGAVQWLWMLLVISEFMHWTMYFWRDYESYHAVPLILLTLAAYSVASGIPSASRAAAALRTPVLVLLGGVLIAAIREVRFENLAPVWQMQTAYFITAMLIPVMGFGYGAWKGKGKALFYPVAVSMITTGVLSLAYIRISNAPFYDLSRSIDILGQNRRLESLVAAAMSVGYYVLLGYLVGITARLWEPKRTRRRSIWISALFSGLVFVSGMRLNSRLLAVGNILVWVILPLLKNLGKNLKKGIDK